MLCVTIWTKHCVGMTYNLLSMFHIYLSTYHWYICVGNCTISMCLNGAILASS